MEITISIPEELVSQAKSSGLAAEAYVEQLLRKIAADSAARSRGRERLRGELVEDWEHYMSTGLHLDEDEVDAWLERMEDGEDVEPPPLHN
jgi:hypothetical protein